MNYTFLKLRTNRKSFGFAALSIVLSCTTGLTQIEHIRSPLPRATENSSQSQVLELDILAFSHNQTELCCENLTKLEMVAQQHQANPDAKLVLDGHSEPDETDGVALKRARNAYNFLVKDRAIDGRRIIVRTFDDKCRAKDHDYGRVEIYMLPKDKKATEIKKDCGSKK